MVLLASGWGGVAGGGAGLRVGRCGRWWCWPQGGEVWQVLLVLASGWGGVADGGVAGAGFSSC